MTSINPSNPFGANGTQSDPREQVCWDIYVKNLAKGKDNAYQAAIEAGYEQATAKNITVRGWFVERKAKLRRKEMLDKAERNLEKVLDMDETLGTNIPVPQLLKIKTDVSTTIVKTLGKDDGYSDRTEHTGKNGEKLIPDPILGGQSNGIQGNNSNSENT